MPRIGTAVLLSFFASLALSCTTPPPFADLAFVTTRSGVVEGAVENALRNSPGANALVDASFHFERLCLVVRGRAVRVP